MMTKSVVLSKVAEKRKKWAIFEELTENNEALDEAVCILDELKVLITKLPVKLSISGKKVDDLLESVLVLDSTLDRCLETTGVHFEEIEVKLDEMQKCLLHNDACNMHHFSKLVSEVRCSQKLIDTLISNAEEEIYSFLESEGLYGERKKTDIRIMDLVLNS